MDDRTILLGGPLHGTTTPSGGFSKGPISFNIGDGNPVRYFRKSIVEPETRSANDLERFWYVYATEDDATPMDEVVRMLKEKGIPSLSERVDLG
jgi:hypothetical protein